MNTQRNKPAQQVQTNSEHGKPVPAQPSRLRRYLTNGALCGTLGGAVLRGILGASAVAGGLLVGVALSLVMMVVTPAGKD